MASRSSSRKILDQIAQLKNALQGFSFDELTIAEAKALKHSFDNFFINLENGVWGLGLEAQNSTFNSLIKPENYEDPLKQDALNNSKVNSPIHCLYSLIDQLQAENQNTYEVNQLKAVRTFLDELSVNQVGLLTTERDFTKAASQKKQGPNFSPKQVINQVDFIGNTLITTDHLSLTFDVDANLPEFIYGSASQFYELLMKLIGTRISDLNTGELLVKVFMQQADVDQILNIKLLECATFSTENGSFEKDSVRTYGLIELSQLVEKYQGKFWIGNTSGKHAAIHLQIPIIPVASSRKVNNLNDDKLLSGKTILLLQPNSNTYQFLTEKLQDLGGRILTDTDTLKALQKVHESVVDLIVLPLEMEGVDAFQACMRIRNSHKTTARKIPIVCFANRLSIQDKQNLKRVGVNEMITVTNSTNGLLEAIQSCILNENCNTESASGLDRYHGVEHAWCKILNEVAGNPDLFDKEMWAYRSDIITLLGALKVHLTLLDYDQLTVNCNKLNSIITQLQIEPWKILLEEFKRLVHARTGALRMRQLYREMLESYEHWDFLLQEFTSKLRN